MRTVWLYAVSLALALSAAAPALAGYDEGVAAYKRGDYAAAHAEFLVLAEAGHDSSQYNLGLMYAKGQFLAKDLVLARKWFAEAAAQGHPMAQGSLGVMYAKGEGGAKDLAEAKYWLDTALANKRAGAEYKKIAKQALDEVTAEAKPEDLDRAKFLASSRPPIVSGKPSRTAVHFMPPPVTAESVPGANFLGATPAVQPASPATTPFPPVMVIPQAEKPAEPQAQPTQAVAAEPAKPQAEPQTEAKAAPGEKADKPAEQPAQPTQSAQSAPTETGDAAKLSSAPADASDQAVQDDEDDAPKAKTGHKHKHKSKKHSKKAPKNTAE